MRLLKEIPEIEKKIESGSLALSVLVQTQRFFKQEKTKNVDKMELLNLLEGKALSLHSARSAASSMAKRWGSMHFCAQGPQVLL